MQRQSLPCHLPLFIATAYHHYAMKEANAIREVIRKGVENKAARTIMHVYQSMMQPHLEYCLHRQAAHLKSLIIASTSKKSQPK